MTGYGSRPLGTGARRTTARGVRRKPSRPSQEMTSGSITAQALPPRSGRSPGRHLIGYSRVAAMMGYSSIYGKLGAGNRASPWELRTDRRSPPGALRALSLSRASRRRRPRDASFGGRCGRVHSASPGCRHSSDAQMAAAKRRALAPAARRQLVGGSGLSGPHRIERVAGLLGYARCKTRRAAAGGAATTPANLAAPSAAPTSRSAGVAIADRRLGSLPEPPR
jgi:hypothetical protein